MMANHCCPATFLHKTVPWYPLSSSHFVTLRERSDEESQIPCCSQDDKRKEARGEGFFGFRRPFSSLA